MCAARVTQAEANEIETRASTPGLLSAFAHEHADSIVRAWVLAANQFGHPDATVFLLHPDDRLAHEFAATHDLDLNAPLVAAISVDDAVGWLRATGRTKITDSLLENVASPDVTYVVLAYGKVASLLLRNAVERVDS